MEENIYSRFLRGDKGAFDEIIDNYREGVTFFIFSFVKNIDAAEDIAMDVFAEILVHPKRYKFKSSLKSYLYSIAHHKAVDYIRKSREVPSDDFIFKEDFDLLERIIDTQEKETLYKAMNRLSADYRTVLLLTYFENLSTQEAAKIMGKTKKQIGNLIYRAKAKLKSELLKEGFRCED